jgi:ElaB/YqjD/DUF883 family membrane-anchored ribosome-binding protein
MLTCLKAQTQLHLLLTQINSDTTGSPRIRLIVAARETTMFRSSELGGDELQALKAEVSGLLTAGGGVFDAAKDRADALADQIKAALDEFGEILSKEEDQVEKLIADHPITTLASAFALGVVIGFMLRRN